MGTTLFVLFWLLVACGAAAYAFSTWLRRATAPDDPVPEDGWQSTDSPAKSTLPPTTPPLEPVKPSVTFKTHTLEQLMEIPNSAETKGQLQLEYAWYKFATGKEDQTKTNN